MDSIPNEDDLEKLLVAEQNVPYGKNYESFEDEENYLLELRNANALENLEHRSIPNDLFHSSQPVGSPTRNGDDIPSTLDLYSSDNAAIDTDISEDETINQRHAPQTDYRYPNTSANPKMGLEESMDIDMPSIDLDISNAAAFPRDSNLLFRNYNSHTKTSEKGSPVNFEKENQDSNVLFSTGRTSVLHIDAEQSQTNNTVTPLKDDALSLFSFENDVNGAVNDNSLDQKLSASKNSQRVSLPFFSKIELDEGSSFSGPKISARTSSGKIIYFPKKKNRHSDGLLLQPKRLADEISQVNEIGKDFNQDLLNSVRIWSENFLIVSKEKSVALKTEKLDSLQITNCTTKPQSQKLWVDTYRPQLFRDLLGDERVHRAAMHWIKAWDPCVFGKSRLQPSKSMRFNPRFTNITSDSDRPDKRIMMLTGLAGAGKTTLAHVIAHQAGYKVLEINASDDRTAHTVHEKVSSAISNHSALSSQPTCVIVDEIDGGDPAFVRALLSLLESDEKATEYSQAGNSKKKKKFKKLCRPIICICNDLYTPALRPLRPYAQIIYFRPPPQASLVGRLRTICRNENIAVDSRSLTLLTDIYNSDIRSCINSLQLLSLNNKRIDSETIKLLQPKSNSFSTSSLIQSLFLQLDNKQIRAIEASQPTYSHLDALLARIDGANDSESVLMNCFHTYLDLPFTDSLLSKPALTSEWLYFFDQLHSQCYKGNYELWRYIPYSIIHFHYLYATPEKCRLPHPPRSDLEALKLYRTRKEILDSFISTLNAYENQMHGERSILLELIRTILITINPTLKQVRSIYFKKKKKKKLRETIFF